MLEKYETRLREGDAEDLNELLGFLKGLEVAGKRVPALWAFKTLVEGLRKCE